MACQVV